MKLLDYNKVLRDFQYKPNFEFKAYERVGKWWILVAMVVEDARAPFQKWELKPYPEEDVWFGNDWYDRRPRSGVGYSPSRELTKVTGNYVIPEFVDGEDDRFVEWLVYNVRKVEDHETFEWLRYKGELINDPHKE